MDQSSSLSPIDLRHILDRFFSIEELRTISFDLGVDYGDLGGEGQAGKARELVIFMQNRGRLQELEALVRRLRPRLDTIYSPERVQELQESILAGTESDVRDAFIEFTQQIEAYLGEFNLLHEQLQEWKEVHNLLQDVQNNFAPCRGYIYSLGRLRGNTAEIQAQRERLLFEVEVEWRPCKRVLNRLEEFASGIEVIGEPYDDDTGTGPEWFRAPKRLAKKINKALFEQDIPTLTEHLSAFGDSTDQYLYLADKTLREVVTDINSLPRPRPLSSP